MTTEYKNQTRQIIQVFIDEINKVKIEIPNYRPIPFRDDKERNKVRPKFKVPIEYLRFRKDNGRIASDILTYETNKGNLDETTDYAQSIIKRYLILKDPEPTEALLNSIRKDGQNDEAIITADGFLINGNRRKMVLEQLLQLFPGDEKYKYLEVVILPGPKESEPLPTHLDIEQIENRCQMERPTKAEYYNFDKALSIRRKEMLGMSLEEQLRDDPNFVFLPKSKFQKELNRIKEEFIEPLNCIDRYLEYLNRSGHYNTVSEGRGDSEGRWQAFLDYYKNVYKKITDEKFLITNKISEDERGKIEDVAFKIIRTREVKGVNKKAHQIMRELPKLITNSRARNELYELNKISTDLPLEETVNEDEKKLDEKTKDIIWGNKYVSDIAWHVKKAYDILEQKTERDTPIELIKASLDKLFHQNLEIQNIEFERFEEAMKLLREIQSRANEIEHEIYNLKRESKKNLKERFHG